MTHSVAIVDDHAVFRDTMLFLLEREQDLRVAFHAATNEDACAQLDRQAPDVVLLDVMMGARDGLEVMRHVRDSGAASRVLVLSVLDATADVARAISAGAHGYALKKQSFVELADAIRTVARGQRYVAPQISAAALNDLLERARSIATLTPREREVFDLVVQGRSTAATAGVLGLSPRTVETHRAHIFQKLRATSAGDLVRIAAAAGLIPPGWD